MEYSHVSSIARADAAAAIGTLNLNTHHLMNCVSISGIFNLHQGLTEISKQMRKMRATNQKQKEELHRMRKQLEVISETRGTTIMNVQSAFENVCLI